MSHHTNIVRLKAIANALSEWKDKVVFVGGATVSLYATKPEALNVRSTDDVDVVVELLSLGAFYKMQERLLELGFRNDMEAKIISRFLYQGLQVDFMPVDPTILGFSNKWYSNGLKNSIIFNLDNSEVIRLFTATYFIASKIEAFKTRGKYDVYGSHDLEDIIFVLDNKDDILDELMKSEAEVLNFVRKEFNSLLQTPSFIEGLIGLVEQSNQQQRKTRVLQVMERLVNSK